MGAIAIPIAAVEGSDRRNVNAARGGERETDPQAPYARMAPMRTTRRLFALVAAFAVALGALWPLVSAARPTSVAIPSFICTQSGFQHPDVPGDVDDNKFHCPLCVVSMDSAVPVLAPKVAVHAPCDASRIESFTSSVDFAFFAQPPPSRAPPRF